MSRRLGFLLTGVVVLMAIAPLPARAGGFCLHQEQLVDRRSATVDMKDYCFFPQVVRVDKGDVVTWTNYDKAAHTVTAPGGWSGGHDEYLRGDDVSFRFEREGVFPYVCLLHPGMVGAVVVGDGEGRASAAPAARSVGYDSPSSDAAARSDADEPGSSLWPVVGLGAGAVAAGGLLVALAVRLRRRAAPLQTG